MNKFYDDAPIEINIEELAKTIKTLDEQINNLDNLIQVEKQIANQLDVNINKTKTRNQAIKETVNATKQEVKAQQELNDTLINQEQILNKINELKNTVFSNEIPVSLEPLDKYLKVLDKLARNSKIFNNTELSELQTLLDSINKLQQDSAVSKNFFNIKQLDDLKRFMNYYNKILETQDNIDLLKNSPYDKKLFKGAESFLINSSILEKVAMETANVNLDSNKNIYVHTDDIPQITKELLQKGKITKNIEVLVNFKYKQDKNGNKIIDEDSVTLGIGDNARDLSAILSEQLLRDIPVKFKYSNEVQPTKIRKSLISKTGLSSLNDKGYFESPILNKHITDLNFPEDSVMQLVLNLEDSIKNMYKSKKLNNKDLSILGQSEEFLANIDELSNLYKGIITATKAFNSKLKALQSKLKINQNNHQLFEKTSTAQDVQEYNEKNSSILPIISKTNYKKLFKDDNYAEFVNKQLKTAIEKNLTPQFPNKFDYSLVSEEFKHLIPENFRKNLSTQLEQQIREEKSQKTKEDEALQKLEEVVQQSTQTRKQKNSKLKELDNQTLQQISMFNETSTTPATTPKVLKDINSKQSISDDSLSKISNGLKSISGPINVYGSPVNVYGSPVNIKDSVNSESNITESQKSAPIANTNIADIEIANIKELEQTLNNIQLLLNGINNTDINVLSKINSAFNTETLETSKNNLAQVIQLFNNFKQELSKISLNDNNLSNINETLSALAEAKNQLSSTLSSNLIDTKFINNSLLSSKELTTIINQLVNNLNRINSVNISSENLKQLATDLGFVRTEFNNFISIMNTDSEALSTLKSTVSDVANFISLLTNEVSKLSNIGSKFNKTSNNLYSLNVALLDLQQLASNFNVGDLSALETYINNLSELLTKLQTNLSSTDSVKSTIQNVNSLIKLLTNSINNVARSIENLNNLNLSGFESKFNEVVTSITNISTSLNSLGPDFNKQFDDTTAKLKSIKVLISSIDSIIKRTQKAQSTENLTVYFQSLTEVLRNLIANFGELEKHAETLSKLSEMMANLAKAFAVADNYQRKFTDTLNKSNNQLQNSFNEVNTQVQRTTSTLRNFNSNSSGIFGSLFLKLRDLRFSISSIISLIGGRTLYNWLINTNTQIEVLQRSLEVTLQSIQEADLTIRRLRDYAALTPFQELEVFKSGEMLAANRMEIMRWVKVAGDLTSAKKAVGTQLEDVVNVLTRINAGDFGKAMIRLRQLGISLNDLRAEGLKFSKNNTYLGTTDEFLDALERIIQKRYGGLTEVLGQTTEGLISTIKDYIYQLGIELGSNIFDKFKNKLKDLKSFLNEFRNSTDFKKVVREFNEAFNTISEPFKVLFTALSPLFKFIISNLNTIARLITTTLEFKAIQSVFNYVSRLLSGFSSISNTLRTQNQLLSQQQATLAGIDTYANKYLGKLTEMHKILKLYQTLGPNASPEDIKKASFEFDFRLAGNSKKKTILETLTQQSASAQQELINIQNRFIELEHQKALAEQQLLQIKQGLNVVTEQGVVLTLQEAEARLQAINTDRAETEAKIQQLQALRQEIELRRQLATSIMQESGGSVLAGTLATAGSFLGEMLSFVNGAFMVIGVISMITNAINSSKNAMKDPLETKDYDRIIGQHVEETRHLEELNTTRQYAKEQIDAYTKQQELLRQKYNQLNSIQNKTAEQERELAEVRNTLNIVNNDLTKSMNDLKRINEQLLDIAPELADSLIDSSGNLTDETGKFKDNTKAIEANILQRKALIELLERQRLVQAGFEISDYNKEIATNNRTIDAYLQNKDLFPAKANWYQKAMAKVLGSTYGFFGNLFGNEDLLKIQDYTNFYAMSEEDRKRYLEALKIKNRELKTKIDENKKVLKDREEAIKNKFVSTDDEGNLILTYEDEYGNAYTKKGPKYSEIDWNNLDKNSDLYKHLTVDISEWEKYKEKLSKDQEASVKNHEASMTRISEILDSSKNNAEEASKFYDLQALIALNKANGDESDKTYLEFIKKKTDAMIESYNTSLKDLQEVSKQYKATRDAQLSAVGNENLVKLIKGGLSVEQITTYLDQVHKGLDVNLNNKDLEDALKQLEQDINNAKGFDMYNGVNVLLSILNQNMLNTLLNADEFLKQQYLAELELRAQIEKLKAELNKAKTKKNNDLLNKAIKSWEHKKDAAEAKKEIQLLDYQLKGILEGTTAWRNAIINNDKEIKKILLGEINAIQKIMNKLSGDELQEAKSKILQLQKQVKELDLEIAGVESKEVLESIASRYDNKIRLIESERDKKFSELNLRNVEEGSVLYESTKRQYGDKLIALYKQQMNELQKTLPSLEPKKQIEALIKLNELAQKANEILLDIKKNTSSLGEFNKPNNVKVLTYYDYMTSTANSAKVSINNANFAFNVQGIKSVEQFKQIIDQLGDYLQKYYNANVTNRNLLKP